MRKSEINVNTFWEYVRKQYPDARFVHWFEDGELHFYPNGRYERNEKKLGVCFRDEKAHIQIAIGEEWK